MASTQGAAPVIERYEIPNFYMLIFRGRMGLTDSGIEIIQNLVNRAYSSGRMDGLTYAIEVMGGRNPAELTEFGYRPLSAQELELSPQACDVCGGANGAHFAHCPKMEEAKQ